MFWKRKPKPTLYQRFKKSILSGSVLTVAGVFILFGDGATYIKTAIAPDFSEMQQGSELVVAPYEGQLITQWTLHKVPCVPYTTSVYLDDIKLTHDHSDSICEEHGTKFSEGTEQLIGSGYNIPIQSWTPGQHHLRVVWEFSGWRTLWQPEKVIFDVWFDIPEEYFSEDAKLIKKKQSTDLFVTKVKAGKSIKVLDVQALIEAAKKKQVSKITKSSLWSDYHYPPVVEELAKQNGVSPQELITHLAENWLDDDNPWELLQNVEGLYDEIIGKYDDRLIDTALRIIMESIIAHINEEIELGLNGVEV